MDSERTLAAAFDAIRVRITRTFPDQIRAAVAELTDEQIWWRPNEESNSVGNLVLHLTGSLNHYLNRAFGGIEYQRDRAAEFSERKPIPRSELLARFDEMVVSAERTLSSMPLDRLGQSSPEPRMYTVAIEDLVGIATHVANHTGQILWIVKMLRQGALHEVWIESHKRTVWPQAR